ncbi:FimV/HubP family polar landmark protein [Vogesella sp. LIG4]|uniref:FimV/HubP family polar landmark protein n=1 Tax=Vogesella sp. LIG4 TaxID=1192162 RepID=UPI0012FD6159|nr:FimV/HubP family polar landmark protein [Vogesella sp. LIG4]
MSSLLLALLFSTSAWAGLGGIAVRSNLGEALRADIDLTGSGKGDEEVVRVGLASIDTFRDLQVDYAGVLSSLRFTLAYRSNGKPYIRVSSTQPISEPFLRFVVEARAANARYVREYTVLLDPAEYAGHADEISRSPAPVSTAPLKLNRPQPTPVRTRPAATDNAPVPPTYPTAHGNIVVQPGQTLSGIAHSLGMGGVSQRRVMAALVKANPNAFINGNPSSLRAGSALKVPSVAAVHALHEQQVAQILAGSMAASPVSPAKPLAEPAPQTPAKPAAAPAPLPAPAPAAKAPALPPPVASAAAASAPSATPVLKLEAPEASASATDKALQDAQHKIDQLEKQLKALQAQTAAQAAPAKPEGGPSFIGSLLDNLPLVAGGSAAILLLSAAVVFLRRRRGNTSTLSPATINMPLSDAGHATGAATATDSAFLADFTRTSMNTVDTVEVDPVAEAEVYLAYGRDQQAEDILKDALSKDPTRHEVRLKLMEIYASRQDRGALETHAKELHAVTGGQGSVWGKAAGLGRSIDPDNPLYADLAPAAAAGAVEVVASDQVLDLDKELMGDIAADAPSAPTATSQPAGNIEAALAEPAPAADDDLDALLNPPKPATPPEPVPPPPPDNSHMLDFDFNLDSMLPGNEAAKETAAEPDALETFSFDMSSLEPHAGEAAKPAAAEAVPTTGLDVSDDPLSTKLDLARVYLDMGDKEGAREVLEELVKEAQGSLKAEAEALLNTL